MAHPLVLGVFETIGAAAHAARAVHALGVTARELSVVARDHDEEERLSRALDASPGVEMEDSRVAARLGELSGYLVAAIAVGVPGLGSTVAAGPLSAELGEAAGHMAGGLASVLSGAGIVPATALDWESRVRRGAILLGVHAKPSTAEAVRGAFEQSGAAAVGVTNWP